MKPDTSRWRDSRTYDYFDDLSVEGLAWECLRRDPSYQQAYRDLVGAERAAAPLRPRPNISGGCDVPAKPSLPATRQPVHWSPRINPAVTVLTELPDHLLSTGTAFTLHLPTYLIMRRRAPSASRR